MPSSNARLIVYEINCFDRRDGDIMISKDELRPYLSDGFLMYELFRPYGFNRTSTDDLVVTFDQQVGALLTSSYYELFLDREAIFFEKFDRRNSDPKPH